MLAKGYDQGVHNGLLYGELLPGSRSMQAPPPLPSQAVRVRILSHDEVYICAAGMRLKSDIELNGTVVRSWRTRETIAVVHQYNRMQSIVHKTLGCKSETLVPDYCTACRTDASTVSSQMRTGV